MHREGDISMYWTRFKNSGLEFKCSVRALIWASYHGHDKILNWFKNSKPEFKIENPDNVRLYSITKPYNIII